MWNLGVFLLCGGFGPVLLGTAVLIAARLLAVPAETSQSNTMRSVLRVGAWSLIWVGGIATSLFLFFLVVGFPSPPLSPYPSGGFFFRRPSISPGVIVYHVVVAGIFLALAASVIGRVLRGLRIARQKALLTMMAVACERRIALVPVIEAFAAEQRGRVARQARRLAEMLQSGIALPDALAETPGLLPHESLASLRVGYQSGMLAPALRQVETTQLSLEPVWQAMLGRLFYCGVLVCVGLFTITYMLLVTVPQITWILDDYDVSPPAVTGGVLSVSEYIDDQPYVILPLIALVCLALLALFVYAVLRDAGAIRIRLPGASRVLRRLDTANIMEALAIAADQGQPLEAAFESMARHYPARSVRLRLCEVLSDMRSGGDWCDAMLRFRLLRPADRGVLHAAQRVGNLPWALREMADSNRRRLARRLYASVQLVYPPIILAVGGAVCLMAAALFMSLVSLIQELT